MKKPLVTNGSVATNTSAAAHEWRPAGLREWCVLILLLAIVPALLLTVGELVLRSLGYGYPTTFFIQDADGQHYRSNRQFGWQFFSRESAIIPHPVLFPVTKKTGTVRIFVLGESAAAGTPDPSIGFARILELMLRQQYPGTNFEVINAAMRGINSHIVCRIAKECVRYQPDLLLVYMGNNEFVGLYVPESKGFNFTLPIHWFRAVQWIRTTKLAQLMESVVARIPVLDRTPSVVLDMNHFRSRRAAPDDPRRAAAHSNFLANLNDIATTVRKAGVKTVVSTIAVNLQDCPPLGSVHPVALSAAKTGEWEKTFADGVKAESNDLSERAIASYHEATRVDGGFAEVHFRLARCYAATGKLDEACEHYAQARDCDALQFRADRRINELIRRVGSGREADGIFLADLDRAISQSELAKGRLPGDDLFHDHVHFSFNGDYQVAKTLLPIVETALGLRWFEAQVPSEEQCAASLAFTTWDEVSTAEPMVQLTAQPPFVDQLDHSTRQTQVEQHFASRAKNLSMKDTEEAIGSYRRAISKRADDWQLSYNFGKLLVRLKRYDQAARQFENALRLFPDLFPAEISLGDSLLGGGKVDEAIEHFAKAIQIDPHSNVAKRALVRALEAKSAAANPATHQDLQQNWKSH